MNIILEDPLSRVFRLMYRKVDNCVFLCLDLHSGFRGKVDCEGGQDGFNFMMIRPISTRTERWDKKFITLKWKNSKRKGLDPFYMWSKGTLYITFAPMDKWCSVHAKDWVVVKDSI